MRKKLLLAGLAALFLATGTAHACEDCEKSVLNASETVGSLASIETIRVTSTYLFGGRPHVADFYLGGLAGGF